MPEPHGRDRVALLDNGQISLGSLRPKGWEGRDGSVGPVVRPGTAVQWDDALYEVLRVEPSPAGGTRYLLALWEDRLLVRSVVTYGRDHAGVVAAPPGSLSPVASSAADSGDVKGWGWSRLPRPLAVLILGGAPALLLGWFLPVRILGEGMSAFVHELGHAAVAILFGRLAVPAVILTVTFEQSVLAAGAIWAGLLFVCWYFRDFRDLRSTRFLLWGLAALYPFLAFTPLHLDLIHVAGHGAEVVIAAFFLYRALTGGLFAEAERPVYAFFAVYLWLRNARLFLGVATDPVARTDYLSIAITGENDLVKVASGHHLELSAVAFVAFLVAALLPAFALLLAVRELRRQRRTAA